MGSSESDDRKRKRAVQEAGTATDPEEEEKSKSLSLSLWGLTRPAPSEEEVEEFFTLIRRIHNVKYYSGGKSSSHSGADHHHINIEGRRMELLAGLSAAKVDQSRKGTQGVSIDLNAVPEEAGDGNGS